MNVGVLGAPVALLALLQHHHLLRCGRGGHGCRRCEGRRRRGGRWRDRGNRTADLHEVDDLVAVVAAPEAEITAARLPVGQAGVRQQEGPLPPLAAVGLADHTAAAVRVTPGVVLQLPLVCALVVVDDGQSDLFAGGHVVQVAVVHVENHVRIVRRLVGAAGVAPFLVPADVPLWHGVAARRVVLLVQPEIVVAPLRIVPGAVPFRLAQGHPDTGCIVQRASQVLVGEAQHRPAGLVRDHVGGQHHVVGMFVQAVVDAPQGPHLPRDEVIVAFPGQGHLVAPLEHGIVLANAVADGRTAVGLQAVVLEAHAPRRGVVGELLALVPLIEGRGKLQEQRRAGEGLPVEVCDPVHRLHPQVWGESGVHQAFSVVGPSPVLGRPGLAVHPHAHADPGDAGVAVVAGCHIEHEVGVVSEVGGMPVAGDRPVVVPVPVAIAEDQGLRLQSEEPEGHRVTAGSAVVDAEADAGGLAERGLGLQPVVNDVPAIFVLSRLEVLPGEDVVAADDGIGRGIEVVVVEEDVDARPGCVGQPPGGAHRRAGRGRRGLSS